MKKLLTVILAVGMLAGCASLQSMLYSEDLDFVCNPTPEQAETAAQMLAALDAAQGLGTIFYPGLGVVQASAVLTVIKNNGCFYLSQLREAFDAVDAANAMLAAKGLPAEPPHLPEYEPLRRLIQ
jgi:hypothetical protein